MPETPAHPAGASIDLDETPPDAVKGKIDGTYQSIVIGWALSANALGDRRTVELLENGTVIASGVANLARKDLAKRGIGDGNYGFALPIPLRFHDGLQHTLRARDADTQQMLQSEAVIQLKKREVGQITAISGGRVVGWILGPLTTPPEFEVAINGVPSGRQEATFLRSDVKSGTKDLRAWGFAVDLKWLTEPGSNPEVAFRDAASGHHLSGSPVPHARSSAWGVVDSVVEHQIRGWACLASKVPHSMPLELWVDDALVNTFTTRHFRVDLRHVGINRIRCGFLCDLPKRFHDGKPHLIEIRPKGLSKPLKRGRFMMEVASRQPLDGASALAEGPPPMPDPVELPQTTTEFNAHVAIDPVVDIIVPVYRGLDETLACLHSVLNGPDTTPHELIVINDCSPDPQLGKALRELAVQHPRITLLENTVNQGFVATVNRGMKLHPQRDVILLNSDTVAPKSDWIARLRRAALDNPEIGTVTPLSNRATICSFPRSNVDNEMIPGYDVTDMDALCNERNAKICVEIPTAIGFCMYIRRPALFATGYFNEKAWGRGYAEENEFCIRSRRLGWKHVAACNIFIEHHGSVSFQEEKHGLIKRNLEQLNRWYPEYRPAVRAFLAADPLATARNRIMTAVLKRQAPRFVLHVLHSWGGGTKLHVRDLVQLLAEDGVPSLLLRPGPQGAMEICLAAGDLSISFPKHATMAEVAMCMRELGVWHIHFHQTIGLPLAILDLPALCATPFDVTIHDYYLACPRINLLDHEDKFCHSPTLQTCETCVQKAPLKDAIASVLPDAGGSVAGWRNLHRTWLSRARRIFVPSEDTATRFRYFYPDTHPTVQPHPEPDLNTTLDLRPTLAPLRVAIMGAIGPHKGYLLLLESLRLAQVRELPIEFVLVGYTKDDDALDELANIEIMGPYEPQELRGLLEQARCDAALFLSPWPETFSYTLTEAWRAALVPVVTGHGAPADRVKQSQGGICLPDDPSAEEVLQTLLALRERGFGPTPIRRAQLYQAKSAKNGFLKAYYGLAEQSKADGQI